MFNVADRTGVARAERIEPAGVDFLHVLRAMDHTGNGIGGSQSQIIMTMARENRFINITYIVYQVSHLFCVLVRQTKTCCVRNIDNSCARFNNGFGEPC